MHEVEIRLARSVIAIAFLTMRSFENLVERLVPRKPTTIQRFFCDREIWKSWNLYRTRIGDRESADRCETRLGNKVKKIVRTERR